MPPNDRHFMARRAAPLVLWTAALVLFLILGAWAMLPLVVSSEVVRSAIENELTEITGRPVTVEGRVDLDLFPSPIARLYQLRIPGIETPESPEPEDFLFADRLEVTIPFSSLVSRNPAFTRFRLVRPAMRVETQPGGGIDWDSIGGRLGNAVTALKEQQTAAATAEGEEAAEDPQQVELPSEDYGRFGTIMIADGTVSFYDGNAQEPEKVTGVTGTVSWPRLSERLTANLSGVWRGQTFEQNSEIDHALRFFAGQLSTVRLGFKSAPLTYSFDGKLATGGTLFAEGGLQMTTPSMRNMFDWLEIGITSGRSVGALSLQGIVHGDLKKVRLENLKLDLQGNDGTGIIEFAMRDGGQPSITGTLDFVDLDILSYVSALSGMPLDRAGVSKPVSLAPVNEMDVDLRMSAANATAGPLKMTEVAAVTQIRNGVAIFEVADATAYGGQVQARFGIGESENGAQGEMSATADNIDTAALAQGAGFNGLIPMGKTTLKVSTKATISNWSDLWNRANGTLEMNSTGGTIAGVGYDRLSGQYGEEHFFRLQQAGAAGATYDQFHLDALVQDGVMIIDDASIVYPAGKLVLSGVVPYGTASLAVTTIAYPKGAEGQSSGTLVQHFIGGSWTNPYGTRVLSPEALR